MEDRLGAPHCPSQRQHRRRVGRRGCFICRPVTEHRGRENVSPFVRVGLAVRRVELAVVFVATRGGGGECCLRYGGKHCEGGVGVTWRQGPALASKWPPSSALSVIARPGVSSTGDVMVEHSWAFSPPSRAMVKIGSSSPGGSRDAAPLAADASQTLLRRGKRPSRTRAVVVGPQWPGTSRYSGGQAAVGVVVGGRGIRATWTHAPPTECCR